MMHELQRRVAAIALCALVGIQGCDGEAQPLAAADAPPPGRAPTQFVIGVDISASRSGQELQDARALLQNLAATLQPGDRVVFIETFRAGTNLAREWADSIPALRRPPGMTGGERRRRADFRDDVAAIAGVFVDSVRSRSITTTDLISTLWRAADHARASGGRATTLILLSDMLNSTPELNMERPDGVPGGDWVARRQADGRIPRLDGVCVIAVGAEMKSARGPRVQAFWDEYLRAAGSGLPVSRFHAMVSDPGELRC